MTKPFLIELCAKEKKEIFHTKTDARINCFIAAHYKGVTTLLLSIYGWILSLSFECIKIDYNYMQMFCVKSFVYVEVRLY